MTQENGEGQDFFEDGDFYEHAIDEARSKLPGTGVEHHLGKEKPDLDDPNSTLDEVPPDFEDVIWDD